MPFRYLTAPIRGLPVVVRTLVAATTVGLIVGLLVLLLLQVSQTAVQTQTTIVRFATYGNKTTAAESRAVVYDLEALCRATHAHCRVIVLPTPPKPKPHRR